MSEHASEAAKKLAERLFSDDHARVRLYAESMIQRALDAAAAEAIETVEDFLLTERILIQRLLGQLQSRHSYVPGAPTSNSWAVAEIPEWELRQRLDAVEQAIRALAAPQQAEQPLVKVDTEGLKRMGLRVRIEAEQPDHAFEPGPWYEAERGDGDTITNRLCRVCKRSENVPTHRRAEGGSRG